jgi:hypothetical protein
MPAPTRRQTEPDEPPVRIARSWQDRIASTEEAVVDMRERIAAHAARDEVLIGQVLERQDRIEGKVDTLIARLDAREAEKLAAKEAAEHAAREAAAVRKHRLAMVKQASALITAGLTTIGTVAGLYYGAMHGAPQAITTAAASVVEQVLDSEASDTDR